MTKLFCDEGEVVVDIFDRNHSCKNGSHKQPLFKHKSAKYFGQAYSHWSDWFPICFKDSWHNIYQ